MAVDALFFKPDVQVNVDGTTSGFLENPKLDKKKINSFRRNIETFSIFIQNNWKNIIHAGFVYQVNPFQMNKQIKRKTDEIEKQILILTTRFKEISKTFKHSSSNELFSISN